MADESTAPVQLQRGTWRQNARHTGPDGSVTINTDIDALHVHDGVTKGGRLFHAFPENNTEEPGLRMMNRWVPVSEVVINPGSLLERVVIPEDLVHNYYDLTNKVVNVANGEVTAQLEVAQRFSIVTQDPQNGLLYGDSIWSGADVAYPIYNHLLEHVGDWVPPTDTSSTYDGIVLDDGNMALVRRDGSTVYHFTVFNPTDGTVVSDIANIPSTLANLQRIIPKSDGNFLIADGTDIYLMDVTAGTATVAQSYSGNVYVLPTTTVGEWFLFVDSATAPTLSVIDETLAELSNLALPVKDYVPPAYVPDDRVVFGDRDGNVITCYNRDFTVTWETTYGDGDGTRPETTWLVASPYVVLASHRYDNGEVAMDATTGEILWRRVTGDDFRYTALFETTTTPGQF